VVASVLKVTQAPSKRSMANWFALAIACAATTYRMRAKQRTTNTSAGSRMPGAVRSRATYAWSQRPWRIFARCSKYCATSNVMLYQCCYQPEPLLG
jgi:hypothetical protein